MTKSEAIILMYTKLITRNSFSKNEIKALVNVHDLTFLRYVQDLKKYVKRYVPNKALVYSRRNDCYYLVETDTLKVAASKEEEED